MAETIYKVKDQDRFVMHLADYKNGILTTGGLYQESELEQAQNVISVTYNAEACTELPVGWHRMRWLDDNNKRQFIKEIIFGTDKPYLMEDGTLSREVTE